MKEKSLLIERMRKSVLEIILGMIGVVSFILAILYLLLFKSQTGFFIFMSITILVIMGIFSVSIYKKETSSQSSIRKLTIIIRIIWNYTILLSVLSILYKIYFSKIIIQDKSYWIYDLMAYYVMFSIILKYIIRLLNERKRIIAEKEGILSHCFNVLYTVWMIVFANIFFFYLFYIPVNTIDFDNVTKPYYLSVSEYKYGEFKLYNSRFKNIRIYDDNLLENFVSELSHATIKNMRGVEYLVEEKRSKDELYYMIKIQYKDSNGNDIERPYIFDNMYFSEMRLYKNGDLILKNYRLKHSFPFNFYNTELYKVNLSQELTNQLIALF